MIALALVVGFVVAALIGIAVVAPRLAALERRQKDAVRAITWVSRAARGVDDRLTYYEHRTDGLKSLRAAYDKKLAKVTAARAQADETDDAAPEGTAQAEHLVG